VTRGPVVASGAVALRLAAEAASSQSATGRPAAAPTSCVTCHQRQQGALQAPIGDWQQSVHGKAGIGCEGCHGGDLTDERLAHSPSAGFVGRPRLRDYPYLCGKCHAEIRDRHIGSVHGANGLPHCVSCHGAHAVQHPDPATIITEAECSKCHVFAKARTAQEMLAKARSLLVELEAFKERVEHIPGVVGPLERMQQDLRLDRAGVLSTFHSFRIGDIQQIGSNADRVMKTVANLREREERRLQNYARERPMILAMMGFFALCAAFGYSVYHGKDRVISAPTGHDHDHH
jgi:hypothetical protein